MKLRAMVTGVRSVGSELLGSFDEDPQRYKEEANQPSSWCSKDGTVFGK
jgi:hypothetical protein